MARPRLGEEHRRTRTLGVRLTVGEAEQVSKQARAAGLSMGAYVRRRALGQPVRAEEERQLGTAERRELNRIGSNLNQIARRLNSGAARAPAGTRAAVMRVGELVASLLSGEGE